MILAAIFASSFFNLRDQAIETRPHGINHPKIAADQPIPAFHD
jgi:hypothetical protein